MELPKYYELYNPLLAAIQDGQIYPLKDVKLQVAASLNLQEEQLNQMLPSGSQRVYDNRIGWAKSYLKKAGLLDTPKRAYIQITAEGKKVLDSGVTITDDYLSARYPNFAAFKTGKSVVQSSPAVSTTAQDTEETPYETFERVYSVINEQLADDLLTEITQLSSAAFEKLVVDLMKAMNYGEGFVTKSSGDGGIDGIIHEDRLGFNLIYIQAKRWDKNTSIGRPEIQKFAGAMMGPPRIDKGLFITTAKFSQGAKVFADAQHIILIDGQKLANLMIEYNLGISTQKVYYLKRIDGDYFSDMT